MWVIIDLRSAVMTKINLFIYKNRNVKRDGMWKSVE